MTKISHRDPRFIEGFVKECHALGLEPEQTEDLYARLEKNASWLKPLMGAAARSPGKALALSTPVLGAIGVKHYWDKLFPHQSMTGQVDSWENQIGQRQGLVSQMAQMQTQGKALDDQIAAAAAKAKAGDVVAGQKLHELYNAKSQLTQSLRGYTDRFTGLSRDITDAQAGITTQLPGAERDLLGRQAEFNSLSAAKQRGGIPGIWAGMQMGWKNRKILGGKGNFNAETINDQVGQATSLRNRVLGFNGANNAPAQPKPKQWAFN